MTPEPRIATEHSARVAKKQIDPRCAWTQDEDGHYHTDCGHAFVFTDGAPTDNGFLFCGYCGAPILDQPYPAETESEPNSA